MRSKQKICGRGNLLFNVCKGLCFECHSMLLTLKLTFLAKGPYIKYVGGGGGERRVFVGVMKHFSKSLMGHKIFSHVLFL